MFVAIGVLLILVGILTIWFNISYSPVKKQFQNDVAALLNENQLSVDNEIFTEKDFAHLPIAIQKYIENCGYIGTPKISYLKMEYHRAETALLYQSTIHSTILSMSLAEWHLLTAVCSVFPLRVTTIIKMEMAA